MVLGIGGSGTGAIRRHHRLSDRPVVGRRRPQCRGRRLEHGRTGPPRRRSPGNERLVPGVVDWAQIRVALDQRTITRTGTVSESAAQSFLMAYLMAILLFMAILLYGVNVMSSVLEEKTTRIIEVLVSSVRPFQLMLGKILGAGSVSFFQFVIWGVSVRVLLSLRGPSSRAPGADPPS